MILKTALMFVGFVIILSAIVTPLAAARGNQGWFRRFVDFIQLGVKTLAIGLLLATIVGVLFHVL